MFVQGFCCMHTRLLPEIWSRISSPVSSQIESRSRASASIALEAIPPSGSAIMCECANRVCVRERVRACAWTVFECLGMSWHAIYTCMSTHTQQFTSAPISMFPLYICTNTHKYMSRSTPAPLTPLTQQLGRFRLKSAQPIECMLFIWCCIVLLWRCFHSPFCPPHPLQLQRCGVEQNSSPFNSRTLLQLSLRGGAGVETQKNVRGEIGGWGRIPFNETYAPSLSTIYYGA